MHEISWRPLGLGAAASIFLAVVMWAVSVVAQAADYPNRPIRILVPYTAGGVTDLVARQLGRLLEKDLKQPIVIDNKPGANGTMGALQMVNAAPDGYLLSIVPIGIFRQPQIESIALDPLKQLTYISSLVDYNYFVVVRKDAPWNSIGEFVAAMKKSGVCSYATPGVYSTPHLSMEDFQKASGFACTHIPFKGAADVTTALLGGQIDVIATSGGGALDSFVGNGKLRLLASLGEVRAAMYPQVPTLKENDIPVVAAAPFGLVGPAGMEPRLVQQIDNAVRRAMQDKSMTELVNKNSAVVQYMGPKDYLTYAHRAWDAEKLRFAVKPPAEK